VARGRNDAERDRTRRHVAHPRALPFSVFVAPQVLLLGIALANPDLSRRLVGVLWALIAVAFVIGSRVIRWRADRLEKERRSPRRDPAPVRR